MFIFCEIMRKNLNIVRPSLGLFEVCKVTVSRDKSYSKPFALLL